jgi:hypothetical protein
MTGDRQPMTDDQVLDGLFSLLLSSVNGDRSSSYER